jgi:hypothetical protein
VITEFTLLAAHTLQGASIVKNDRENPQPPCRRPPSAADSGMAADKIHRLL